MKKFAFTLAEVLITLGIIGVVAAMTIPTLMSKIQKKVYYNRLLKSRATVEQGFKRILAGEQTDSIGGALGILGVEDETERAEKAKEKIMEYFKVTQFCINKSDDEEGYCGKHLRKHPIKQYYMNSQTPISGLDAYKYIEQYGKLGYVYTLIDGTRFVLHINQTSSIGNIIVDINGDKAPNRQGYDIFRFILAEDSHLIPYGSQELDKINGGTPSYWRNCNSTNSWCGCGTPKEGYNHNGEGCAGRVMEEGGIKY